MDSPTLPAQPVLAYRSAGSAPRPQIYSFPLAFAILTTATVAWLILRVFEPGATEFLRNLGAPRRWPLEGMAYLHGWLARDRRVVVVLVVLLTIPFVTP